MAKIKLKPIVKRHEGETYTFINGVAEVPGMRMGSRNKRFSPKPVTITLKEFFELIKEK